MSILQRLANNACIFMKIRSINIEYFLPRKKCVLFFASKNSAFLKFEKKKKVKKMEKSAGGNELEVERKKMNEKNVS